jgi:hypothetical protein
MAVCGLVLGGQSLLAQQITSVPNNAVAMVKVNNLEKVSQKVSMLSKQWGLAVLEPRLADPLATLQQKMGIKDGLNKSGEAAVIFFQSGMGAPEPLVLLPVTDYDVFLKNFPDAETKDGISTITWPADDMATPAYVAKMGAFAAISPSRAIVTAKPAATKLEGLAAKEMAEKDVVAYVNFKGFRMQAVQALGFGRMMAVGQIDQMVKGGGDDKAKYAPVVKAAADQLFNGLDHFINETQAMTYGVSLSDEGVQVTYMAEFEAESYLGGLVKKWNSPAASIAGLPQGQHAVTGALTLDSGTIVQVLDDAASPVVVEVQRLGDEGKPFLDYYQTLKDACTSTKSESFAISASDGAVGKSPIFESVVVMNGDAEKLVTLQRNVVTQQLEVQKRFVPAGTPMPEVKVEDKAMTVNGVQLSRMTTKVDAQGGGPQEQMVKAMYGEEGLSVLFGKVAPDKAIVVRSGDQQKIAAAIDAAKAGAPLMDAQTQQVAARLPSNAFTMVFIHGEPAMKLAGRVSEMVTGIPVKMQIPPNTPPIGMTMATDGSAVRGDIFVPSALVQSAISAALQEAIKQQQAPNAGGL